MKIAQLLLLFNIIFMGCAVAQPAIQWQHTIGGDSLDYLYLAEQTTDGGYILGGSSRSNISGEKTENEIGWFDYWLVKTDSMGVIQWQNTIGGDSDDVLHVVHQTPDGGYILGGYSASDISGDKTVTNYGDNDFWIVKTDSLGNIQWQQEYGGSLEDHLRSLILTLDGGYLIGGESNSHPSGNKTVNTHGNNDYWVLKIDSIGTIQWQSSHGGSNDDLLYSLVQTTDRGYLLGGYSRSSANGDKTVGTNGVDDYWLIKTDSTGNIQWQQGYGGNDYDQLQSMQQTADGGFILGGYSQSGISGNKTDACRGWYDYWVLKINNTGAIQWQKTLGGDSVDYLYSIRQTTDHGYILGGSSTSHATGDKIENAFGGSDYWIIRLDSTGSVKWQKQYGGTLNDIARSVIQTTNLDYIIGGDAYSNISGNKTEPSRGFNDYWVIKINHELRLESSSHSDVLCHGDSSGVASVNVSGGAPAYTYLWIPSGGAGATASNLAAGTYTCSITDGGGGITVTNFVITQPSALTSSITSHTNLFCNGFNNGNAVVVASGGIGGYSYEWNTSPVQTTDTATNLAAGSYTVTVTDANGCVSTDTVTITQPPAIISLIASYFNERCYGDTTASAKITAHGGTGTLTYSWNTTPPQSNQTALDLRPQTYTCTVTDANGCTTTSSVTITQPPQLVSGIITHLDVSPCPGGNNGMAVADAIGGTGAYTYSWNTVPPQVNDTAFNLSVGNYVVTVSDGNGCTSASFIRITEPQPITPAFTTVSPICGHSNGSVTATVQNGTPPYHYLWSNGDTTNIAIGLTGQPADTLILIISDANNCRDTSSTVVNCRTCYIQASITATPDSCPLTSINVLASSTVIAGRCGANTPTGVAPNGALCNNPDDTIGCPLSNIQYAYLQSPPCLGPTIDTLTIVSVYVSLDSIPGTNSHGCGNDNRLWLRSPDGTLLTLVDTKPLNQNTDNKYKPTFTPAGTLGIIPNVNNISYNGSDYKPDGGGLGTAFAGESLYGTNSYATYLGLGAGIWIAYLSDDVASGCTDSVRITEFCITFRNSSGNLTYAWSSSGNCTSYLSDSTVSNPQFTPPTGIYDCTYHLTVNDSCGCSGTDSLRIFCFSPLSADLDSAMAFTIYPNPTHEDFTITFNEVMGNGQREVILYDVTGREVQRETINRIQETVRCQLNAGVYFVKVIQSPKAYTDKLVIE